MPEPPLPAPDDFSLQILVWLGVPTILVILIATVIAVLGWIGLARNASAFAMRTASHTATILMRRGVNVTATALLAAQAAFVACAWVVLQFTYFFSVSGEADPDVGGVNVLRRAVDFSRETTDLALWGTLVVAAIIVLLDLGIAAGLDFIVVPAIWFFIGVIGLMGLGTLFNLFVTLLPGPTDTEGLTAVYGTWLVLCAVSTILALVILSTASDLSNLA